MRQQAAALLESDGKRIAELEAELPQALTEQRRTLVAAHDADIAELKRVRAVAKEMIEKAEAALTEARRERDEERERCAKIAEQQTDALYIVRKNIATAIRAGNKEGP